MYFRFNSYYLSSTSKTFQNKTVKDYLDFQNIIHLMKNSTYRYFKIVLDRVLGVITCKKLHFLLSKKV